MPFILHSDQLSKMLSCRNKSSHYTINREWLLGFIEAEGSFSGGVTCAREKNAPATFECSQHSSDYFLMCAIKEWIGAGKVYINARSDGRICAVYTLRGKQLESVLLPLFQGATHTPKIEQSVIPWCKANFSHAPAINYTGNISKDWLVGFADGDGSFYTTIRQQKDYRIGFQFQTVFDLSQKADADNLSRNSLLKRIQEEYFSDAPKALINTVGGDLMDRLRLVSAKYLQERCIPLFCGKLQSRKEIQLALFQDAVQYILAKQHLDPKNKGEIDAFISRCKEWKNRHSAECEKEISRILAERKKNDNVPLR